MKQSCSLWWVHSNHKYFNDHEHILLEEYHVHEYDHEQYYDIQSVLGRMPEPDLRIWGATR